MKRRKIDPSVPVRNRRSLRPFKQTSSQVGSRYARRNRLGQDTVVLTVWDITVSNSPENKKADEKGNLTWRLDNLPTEFASLKSVRELVEQLKDAGRLRSLRELRLVTLDGQNAMVQVGANKPEVTGSNYSSRGGRANSVTFRQVGTTIDALPASIRKKHLQIQFEYNMSDLQKSE